MQPPLRPHASDVATLDALTRHAAPRLLLGVTPDLAGLAGPLVALDWSAAMIARIWPGPGAGRTVIQGDWRAMPFAAESFGSALGDGVLNMLRWPDETDRVIGELGRVVRAGGPLALRVFCAPDERETLAELRGAVMAGGVPFHAFKWRLAQAVMDGNNVALRAVWAAFQTLFPDRDVLSAATGWSRATIAEIDDYRCSPLAKCFPTRRDLRTAFPDARLVESVGYPLAERCPVLVLAA